MNTDSTIEISSDTFQLNNKTQNIQSESQNEFDDIPKISGITELNIAPGISEIDATNIKNSFASKKYAAEGMMDIALLTANANQLRFLITYNRQSETFYFSVAFVILSLILQIAVGITLIFKRHMKKRGKRNQINRTNDFLVGGVFIITVINILVASFTTTDIQKN